MSDILPPFRFRYHNYPSITRSTANRLVFRVHAASGRGALVPNVGFIASGCPVPVDDPTCGFYTGPRSALCSAASTHVTQWKERTSHLPSSFLSASFSFPYALFEATRWNAHHRCTDTHISVIDTARITTSAWLATELVGADGHDAAFFARAALEVLFYEHIPYGAVVVTAPLSSFLDGLPRWCDDIKSDIQTRQLCSTKSVARALAHAAAAHNNNPDEEDSDEEEDELVMQSVERSIEMLRNTPHPSIVHYDRDMPEDAVEAIVLLATMFVWWPKWITCVGPAEYGKYYRRVRREVLDELRRLKKLARRSKHRV
ncbi:hypothetical protein B0H11DRAFT_1981112 [Mycena galericulata]|nr:hypothetical protein B0H11DRAFT_1981112 [Mycena galericulata]